MTKLQPYRLRLIDMSTATGPYPIRAYDFIAASRPEAERAAALAAMVASEINPGVLPFDVDRLADDATPAHGEYVPDTDPAVDIQVTTHLNSIDASIRNRHSTLRSELAMYRGGLVNHLREGSPFFAEAYRRIIAALES